MFYSHTFLAKKSPLGTVWIAAHLQNKLRKSHVAVTDISSTVDCIIFPEVPIALRLSGHLLLGIVRIYSKKVDYLFHDCNDVLSQMRTMFASVHVNLPADADRATFQAVTLPDTFELDALELDLIYEDEAPDNHLRTLEQITLPDQIPVEGDPYVAFIISEERFDSSPQPESRSISGEPTDENIHGSYQDSGHHVDSVLNHGASVETHPQSADIDHSVYTISPVEVARNAARSSSGLDFGHESDDLENAILESHGSADMLKDIGGSASPAAGPLPVSGEESLPFLVREDSQALPSLDASAGPNTGLGGHSVELELEPSPQAKKQKRKSRKRKQFFDASLVLTNEEMKGQLDDTGGIVRKRQKLPCSAFDNWMFLKNTQKEQIFDGPLLPGICIKLQEILDRTIPTQVNAAPPNSVDDMDVEIERARDDGTHAEAIFEPMPSPSEREEPSLVHPSDSSVPRTTITPEPEVQWRPEILTSYEQLEPGTSPADIGEVLVLEMAHSPEVPGLQQSPVEDLLFLDTESTPSGQGTSELDTMSARTRLVAHFFKEQSPMTQLSDDRSGQLSLTTILQGKTRKQCARMFFETLVLKTCDLVDVNQEEAYGDILVTLTPSLSKSTL